jgi:GTP-binding protein
MRVLCRFLLAATDPRQFPAPRLPEIAFLGRSNVGKSALINSLVGTKIAKTSSAPGRTRSVNFFEIRWPGKPAPEVIFTDLPGYGYARIAREEVQKWPAFVEPYLRERPSLSLCLALIDVNVPTQASDRELVEFLSATGRAFRIVATKSDRPGSNELRKALDRLAGDFPRVAILPYSARTGAGKQELWQEIRAVTEQDRAVER